MSSFKEKALADKRLKRFSSRRERGVYVLDTEQLLDEISNMHETRYFRGYNVNDVMGSSQKRLLKADIQNSAYRSRATAINMRCFRVLRLLEEDIENISNYLSTRYMLALKSDFTTKEDRSKAVKDVLRESVSLKHKIQTVSEMTNILIKDLDAEGWAINRAIEIFKLSTTKERNI
jgi:hypothetical protein